MKFCPYCAEEVDENAIKCEHCGKLIMKRSLGNSGDQEDTSQRKSPGMAAVLSLILPGAGHIYNGRVEAGIMLMILAIMAGMVAARSGNMVSAILLVNAYGIVSSFLIAKGINIKKLKDLAQNKGKVGLAGCPNCGAVFVYVTGTRKVTCPSCEYTTVVQANAQQSSLII